MWVLEGGQASRMGGQAQSGPFLSGSRTWAGALPPKALLCEDPDASLVNAMNAVVAPLTDKVPLKGKQSR